MSREDARRLHCKICRDYCTCYRNPETCEDLKAFDGLSSVTSDVVSMEVIEAICEEIELQKKGFQPSADYYKAIDRTLFIIDKHISEKEKK